MIFIFFFFAPFYYLLLIEADLHKIMWASHTVEARYLEHSLSRIFIISNFFAGPQANLG